MTNRQVGTGMADGEGRFSALIQVPDLNVGRYELTALCGPTLVTMVDIVLVSRLEQGMSLSVLLVLFVLIAALYAVNQVGERRTP